MPQYNMKSIETISFPQDMIQDIFKSHWNIIHKSTGVTWNVGPYKLIRLPGRISKAYNVLRIVAGRKRFSLYRSQIYVGNFIDISVIWFTKFCLCWYPAIRALESVIAFSVNVNIEFWYPYHIVRYCRLRDELAWVTDGTGHYLVTT